MVLVLAPTAAAACGTTKEQCSKRKYRRHGCGEVVLEPQVIDFDTFIKRVEASEYAFDGNNLRMGKALLLKWSPESGCLGNNCGQTHEGIEHNSAASNRNVPNKVNSSLAQFYLANNGGARKMLM